MKKILLFLACFLSLWALAQAASYQETPISAGHEAGEFVFEARGADGSVLWSEVAENALADEGEYLFLDVVLRGGTAPTQYYLRLYNDTPVETDTLATLTGEPSGSGYAASLIERSATGWPTLALDSGDHQATASSETITASGGSIGPVTYVAIATTSDNTGKLLSYAPLSQSRTLASGESLTITYRLKQQ